MIPEILTALAVVAAVGLIAGILLALASHFFAVPREETYIKIREALPSVNCGACGYAGCDDYAKALTEGTAKPNLCIPGGAGAVAEISSILGIEVVEEPENLVAFVRCGGNSEATTKKAIYDGINTCSAASIVYGGPDSCRYGCMGLGDCALACPTAAICVKDGIAHINPLLCIGCGLCARTCPKQIIELIPRESKTVVMCKNRDKGAAARSVCKNACIACKKCELNCPDEAIKVIDNLAQIDYDKCTGCGVCADVCPTHCIKKIDLFA